MAALFVAILAAALTVLITMVGLLVQFQVGAQQATVWRALVVSLGGAGIALSVVAIVHLSLLAVRHTSLNRRERLLTAWTELWSEVAVGGPTPALPEGESDIPSQAAALVLQDVTGEGASRIRGALLATGLVAADIAEASVALQSRLGRATPALERLAWIAAPEALPVFQRAVAVSDPRAARAALLGASRVLAAQERPEEFGDQVVRIFEGYIYFAPDQAGARAYMTSVMVAAGPHLVWLCAAVLSNTLPSVAHAAALDALSMAQSPEAKEIATEMLLVGTDDETRAAALRTLARIGQVPASAVDAVLVASEDEHEGVRVQATHALVGTRASIAVPALWRLLGDRSFEVRLAAAEALRRMGLVGRETLRRAVESHPDAFARGIATMVDSQPRGEGLVVPLRSHARQPNASGIEA